MDFKDLEELIKILEDSGLSELEIEEDGRRIRLQKPQPGAGLGVCAPLPAAPAAPIAVQGGAVESPAAEAVPEVEDIAGGLPTFDSPMVGTFYLAPAPGEDPFVKEGDRVDENQTVCIVEAMKLMNEVGAKFAGTIEKVLVENGEPVEFGQPLFAIRALE